MAITHAPLPHRGGGASTGSGLSPTLAEVVMERGDSVLESHRRELAVLLNLASRLCHAAGPGQIVIGQRVLAEVEELVEAEPLAARELKVFGKPVQAFAISATAPVEA